MDRRIGLEKGQTLAFSGMPCTVEREIGRGSNAIVYRGWYPDAAGGDLTHDVLIKELFPYHDKGAIYREENGTVRCLEEGRETFDDHRESFQWGNRIHLSLRKKYPDAFGGNINTYVLNGTFYTVLDFSGGRTLETELAACPTLPSLAHTVKRFIGLLDSLALFHESRHLHLDISPDNVILLGHDRMERVELIDYNSVVSLADIERGDPLRFSLKEGFTAPEVRARRGEKIGFWTDLYAVTAMLFFCLMGKTLSSGQIMGLQKIDIAASPLLTDVPDSVRDMVRKMIRRGLAANPRARYQTTGDMLADFQELSDRIAGVGITHWALWESGSQSVQKEVRANPAHAHLLSEEALYPLSVRSPAGNGLADFVENGTNVILSGSGGTGKTTLLLQTALAESKAYSAARPVVLYLPLYDYTEGNPSFLHDRILQKMRFRPETESYASARHMLDLLLQKPLQTKTGPRPVLCLLLDGYNEIAGDTQALQKEIADLARMDGAAVLITSRYPLPEYDFEDWTLEPLSENTVKTVLGQNGLLLPESPRMYALLQNALMLSLFVRTCLHSGEQLSGAVEDSEGLIQAYLKALLEKELADLPDGSVEKWQYEAAVLCVLPVTAALEMTYGTSAARLLHKLGDVYRHLGRRTFRVLFPHWVGHASEIRGEARKPEEWYRQMLCDILWKRFGLVILCSDGAYRIFHQAFREVLAARGKEILTSIRKKKLTAAAATLLCCTLAAAGTGSLVVTLRPAPYDIRATLAAIDQMQLISSGYEGELDAMTEILTVPAAAADFGDARTSLHRRRVLTYKATGEETVLFYLGYMDRALETGETLPWNRKLRFQREYLREAVELYVARKELYDGYLYTLERIRSDPRYTEEDYNLCRDTMLSQVQVDAQIFSAYHHLLFTQYTDGMAKWEGTPAGKEWEGSYRKIITNMHTLSADIMENAAVWIDMDENEIANRIEELSAQVQAIRHTLAKNPVYVANR